MTTGTVRLQRVPKAPPQCSCQATELCHLGRQEFLARLATLVEPEMPG